MPRTHINAMITPETVDYLRRHASSMGKAIEEMVRRSQAAGGLHIVCCGRYGHPCETVIREGDRTRVSHGMCAACYAAETAAQAAEEGEPK